MSEDADIRELLASRAFHTVFQPIYSLRSGRVMAVEALTRFTGDHGSPAALFTEAHAAGLGVDLELATLRRALDTVTALPAGVSLSVNLSPAALLDTRALLMLTQRQVAAVTVEVTEQATASGYPDLLRFRNQLREMGVRVAIDDVGVSVASVRHLGWLRPDQVKADISLTRMLETDWRRRALARYLLRSAHRRGATVVAEGVETPRQLATWRRLGVDGVQGFLLATPMALGDALDAAPLTPDLLADVDAG
jgi:EAL domain-containing protein (putative c-di-GMP-specific phosphodiesterase class I)